MVGDLLVYLRKQPLRANVERRSTIETLVKKGMRALAGVVDLDSGRCPKKPHVSNSVELDLSGGSRWMRCPESFECRGTAVHTICDGLPADTSIRDVRDCGRDLCCRIVVQRGSQPDDSANVSCDNHGIGGGQDRRANAAFLRPARWATPPSRPFHYNITIVVGIVGDLSCLLFSVFHGG
jgi:hypothetical protein